MHRAECHEVYEGHDEEEELHDRATLTGSLGKTFLCSWEIRINEDSQPRCARKEDNESPQVTSSA